MRPPEMRSPPAGGRIVFCAWLVLWAGLICDAAGAGAGERMDSVTVGAAVLAQERFGRYSGKRIGLLVNHTAWAGDRHLIDIVHGEPAVDLAALFAPEHGLRGEAYAGEEVRDGVDTRSGVPVHSLYGEVHAPTAEMLRGIDVLIFDMQDVGARFYTYITTMGLAMQAAARNGVRFVVLDRPNPLGGAYVSGFVMRPEHRSFIGKYSVPIAHGMTVGELAAMVKGEAMLPGLERLELDVVAMEGWKRAMHWPATGLRWIDPSPAIVDYETALIYAGTGLFEATSVNYGRGTDMPFRLIGAPWIDAPQLAEDVNSLALPGLSVTTVRFTPREVGSGVLQPAYAGEEVPGIRVAVEEPAKLQPVEAGVALLSALIGHAEAQGRTGVIDKRKWLARMAGTDRLLQMLEAGVPAAEIAASWRDEIAAFRKRREPYLLYD